MKDRASVCKIRHFDSEIQIDALSNYPWEEVKPQVDEVVFPDGKRLIVLAKGRLVNLGCATGHASLVMSASFTNQVLVQIELWTNHGKYENKIYVLPAGAAHDNWPSYGRQGMLVRAGVNSIVPR